MSAYHSLLPCVAFAGVMALAVSYPPAVTASETRPSTSLFAQLESFHGHVCAGSIFGARIGMAAKAALKEAGGTGRFTARYYDLSCPVDGIQVASGTTFGNSAIAVEDRDEHRLVLTAEGNRRQVEARLTRKADELGLKSRALKNRAKGLAAGSPERMRIEREIEEIYSWLRSAPDAEVVTVNVLPQQKGSRP